MNAKSADVAVIVGRFQTPFLSEGHKDLIDSVVKNHSKVIIVLGLSPCLVTRNNPLDFESRKQMILDSYPSVIVLYAKDCASDEVWSKKLDSQISDIVTPNQSVVLYGSRDSFLGHYTGKFPTIELESQIFISATEIRNKISKSVKASPDFRSGVIWAAFNQYPTVYPTVDVAILNEDSSKLLLGRKSDEAHYRFIGGFADPKSDTYEQDAKREAQEETGAEVDDLVYIGSFKIDDWRYRYEVNKIKTLFFKAKYIFGAIRADDDIAVVKWFDLDKLQESDIMDGHKQLFRALMKNLGKGN
jgi:bifunctional NMN adenylyltransferase/nudix hydrolase